VNRDQKELNMPNDDMWGWITSPLVGVQKKNADLMRMRKADLNVHNLPKSDDPSQNNGDGDSRQLPPVDAKDDKKENPGDAPTRNADKEEQDKRQKQEDDAKKPNSDRMADAAKDVLKKYAEDNLGKLKEDALDQLGKAWKDSPGGVIAAGTIIGAAGVAYLVGTKSDLPSIPAIPLDFLAKRSSIFKGAELNIEVKGRITGPESIKISITFHEQGGPAGKKGSGKGKVFKLRIKLDSAKADSPETGSDLIIDGKISIPSDATSDDVIATTKAIKDAKVETMVSGTPTFTTDVLSVQDNYIPDRLGLKQPPLNRALAVRLKTSLPPMFHQRKDAVIDAPVWVEINHVGSEGDLTVKAHFQPFPAKEIAPATK